MSGGITYSGDEVFIETDENYHLVNLSKRAENLTSIFGELVEITKLSFTTLSTLDYETAFTGICKDVKLLLRKLNDLAWCEVDDEFHWKQAVEHIYPVIKSREADQTKGGCQGGEVDVHSKAYIGRRGNGD